MNIDLAQYGAAQFIMLYAGLIVLGWLLALGIHDPCLQPLLFSA